MGVRALPSRMRDIATASLSGLGVVGASEIRVVAASATSTPYDYWKKWAGPEYFHTSIATAYGLCDGGRNETLLITPESHSQSTALTLAKNMTHVIGMYGPAMQNQRSRIGHSVTLATLLTVSGQGNTIANLYFPYGLGNATDLNLLKVSGNRNSFVNCHFLQTNATPLDEAGYKLIDLQAAETYFKTCYFGGDTVAWTNGTMINFAASVEPPRVVFDDCLFVMNADNAQVTFLKTVAGLGRCTIVFRNCQFINLGTALTLAIDGTGLGNAKMMFDIRCTFAGVTDIVTAAKEGDVFVGHGGYVSADKLNNLIATNPDVS
jgi:hypothetical protein